MNDLIQRYLLVSRFCVNTCNSWVFTAIPKVELFLQWASHQRYSVHFSGKQKLSLLTPQMWGLWHLWSQIWRRDSDDGLYLEFPLSKHVNNNGCGLVWCVPVGNMLPQLGFCVSAAVSAFRFDRTVSDISLTWEQVSERCVCADGNAENTSCGLTLPGLGL